MLWTHRTIAADPAAAWALLTDTDRWADWGPTVRGGELDSPGRFETGATGHVRTVTGLALPFELTEVVPGRRWSWKVAGIPATAHTVEPADGGVEVGFGVPFPAAAYLAVCVLALRRIESLLSEV
jgi:uncharacterized protein YndB with AHSA1/START domain